MPERAHSELPRASPGRKRAPAGWRPSRPLRSTESRGLERRCGSRTAAAAWAPRRETVGVEVLRLEEAARSFRWWAPGGAPFEGADGCSRHMVVD